MKISLMVLGIFTLWIFTAWWLYDLIAPQPTEPQHIADSFVYGDHAYRSIKIVYRGEYIDVTYKRIKKEK